MPITFQTSTIAVAQIFAMGTLGFYLVRKGLIQESGLKLLSYLSVNIFFPLFIFYQIITNFDAARLSNWWQFPLINIFVPSVGLLMSALVLWRRKIPYKDAFLVVSSLHNGGYIPLLLVMSLPLGALAGQVYTCVILSIIGFDIYLWSVGVWLITRGDSLHMDFKKMINPPLMAMFAAMLIILFFGPGHISVDILKPIKILGEAALGVSMIVIGGNLSLSNFKHVNWTGVTTVTLRNTGGTDHLSFDSVGLPGFQFIQDPLDYGSITHHSAADTYSHAVPEDLMQAAAVIASLVTDFANQEQQFPRK